MKHDNKYPLEQLSTIKKRRLDAAEKELKERKRQLEKEQEKLIPLEKERDRTKKHREDKLEQLRKELDQGTTSVEIRRMRDYLKVVDERLKKEQEKVRIQKQNVEAAEKQVEIAHKEMLRRLQEVEKLSMHKKEWKKEQRIIEEKKEGHTSDEMGSNIHIFKKRQQ